MAVYSKYYFGIPEQNTITDPALSNVTILHVARNGMTHSVTFNEEPRDLQYIYSAFSGGIAFAPDNPFADFVPVDGNDITTLEKVFVKWKV